MSDIIAKNFGFGKVREALVFWRKIMVFGRLRFLLGVDIIY